MAVVIHGRSLLDTVLAFAARPKDHLPSNGFATLNGNFRGPAFASQPAPVAKRSPSRRSPVSETSGPRPRAELERLGIAEEPEHIVDATDAELQPLAPPPSESVIGELEGLKRSCRQSSCLRDVEPSLAARARGFTLADLQAPTDTLLVREADWALLAAQAPSRGSVPADSEPELGPGADPENLAHVTSSNADATPRDAEQRRSCRQSSCLRDVESRWEAGGPA
ncbi:hypothetical protein C8Q78DRAFT_188380 [Trametes maxima]|nr:hypothetical protein C8Q78DRAFT_188380 [Trametes maxima]